jgi:hypothetical protein
MTGNRLENWIKKYHYRLELVRTLVPVVILGLQVSILWKLYH